ncbi:MAG: lysophospholipid acyltransferase family protein [Candidatus Gastranaerophilales bacterium]|nr:lysophospholipid acyltransferase family protein [Candidatus Gastranaerophilales bacterium]
MASNEVLYSDVPPTKLRNREEKFRKASNDPFWTWVADRFFYNMIQHRFYSLKIKNGSNYDKTNKKYPMIFYAPHMNWWDGIVGYNMVRRFFNVKLRMMIEEMNRFPLFAKAGAFPVNKKSPQDAMKSLKYISEDLEAGMGLWIFPQGIIKPPNYRPINFQTGMTFVAEKVAKRLGGINLVPVAVNYVFLREDRPEVMVEIGEPVLLEKTNEKIDRHAFTKALEESFTSLCDSQLAEITHGSVDGYEYLFKQKLPWYKKIEKKLKKVEIKGSGI